MVKPGAFLSKAAFSRLKGWSRSTTTRFAASGRIELTGDGLVDVAASEILLAETADPARDDVAERHALNRPGKAKGKAIRRHGAYGKARAHREHWQAKLAQLDYERESATLIPVVDIAPAWNAAVASIERTMRAGVEPLTSAIEETPGQEAKRALLQEVFETFLASIASRGPAGARFEIPQVKH